ncbi:MAG: hypothetical protein FD129_274 [bacterium]|nr:MAG: hypothetical protein FD129_274 [bacterium]
MPGLDPDDNDILNAGLAFEAGFRGATLFAELTGEYLAEGKDYMALGEGYWRFTPGVRFKLSNTIAMTAALSADVSSDDSATEFNPDDIYPETEFQLGLSLGRVFGQERYESDYRAKEMQKKKDAEELASAQAAAAAAAASRLTGTPVEASAIRAEMSRDSSRAAPVAAAPTMAPAVMAAPMSNEQRMIEMEYRLRFLEMNMKINELEQRMRWMSATPMYPIPAPPDTSSRNLRGENTGARSTTGGSPAATPTSMAASDAVTPANTTTPRHPPRVRAATAT